MVYWGKPWFRPHRLGIGATPSTWQGWVVVAVFVGLFAGVAFLGLSADRKLIAQALVIVVALVVCWAKTEGGWRWRWGGRD